MCVSGIGYSKCYPTCGGGGVKYLDPYRGTSTANLDSLGYKTRLDSPKNYSGRWFATHYEIVAREYPVFVSDEWTHLSDSEGVERWLSCCADHASEFYYIPTDRGTPVARTVQSGAITLVVPSGTTYRIMIPRNASVPTSDPHPPVIPDGGGASRKKYTPTFDPLDPEFTSQDSYPEPDPPGPDDAPEGEE